MAVDFRYNRVLQAAGGVAVAVFVTGFFVPSLGVWTGAVLSAWLVGTQPVLRGLALVAAIGALLQLFFHGVALFSGGWPVLAGAFAGIAAALLPLIPYRLSLRTDFAATLALPFWALTFYGLSSAYCPAFTHYFAGDPAIATFAGPVASVFAVNWFAAVMVWLWNKQTHPAVMLAGSALSVALCVAFVRFIMPLLPPFVLLMPRLPVFVFPCALGGTLILLWSGLKAVSCKALSPQTIALLRSPYNGEPLRQEKGMLVGITTGERFAVKNGIARFVDVKSLTGLNRKYNRLYQIIGGFYDDSQRVMFALAGIERRKYFMQYLGLLEIKPGDRVLETSVGTALNFYYLPRGHRLFGLDLSGEMLANAQTFLARHRISADLFYGNAETLPFADDCMDVVFHTGGINFFSDKAKAIREMIRVAKPGSRILIADETEKLAKNVYERVPITRSYFKGREAEVTTPVDLVPPEMEEIEIHLMRNEEFYALTFRKPEKDRHAG